MEIILISQVLHHIETGLEDLERNAVLNLFASVVSEECFEQLRTREQLGYSVGSGFAAINGVRAFRVQVGFGIMVTAVTGSLYVP